MPGTVTVTAPIGPGLSVSDLALTNVREVTLNPVNASLHVMLADGQVRVFDLAVTTTITATAASGVFTLTIDQ